MGAELDHVFVLTEVGAPGATRLCDLGLTEGSSNAHPGQGTACRRFFFGNAMLELLWVEHEQAVRAGGVRRTGLWQRWIGRCGAGCPFGICTRPTDATGQPPFTTWDYRPPYLPASRSIAMARSSARAIEPLLFHLPFGRRPDRVPTTRREPLAHPLGCRQMTRLRLCSPHAHAPPARCARWWLPV